jgi:hypothetical protein
VISQQDESRGADRPQDPTRTAGHTPAARRSMASLPPRLWDLRASMYPFEAVRDILDPFAAYPWAPDEDGWDRFEWGADHARDRESLYARPEPPDRPDSLR